MENKETEAFFVEKAIGILKENGYTDVNESNIWTDEAYRFLLFRVVSETRELEKMSMQASLIPPDYDLKSFDALLRKISDFPTEGNK